MKNYLIIIVLLFISNSLLAQRPWDMEYIHKDSIDERLIEKEIRIDFKKSISDTLQDENLSIRKLVNINKQDTITLIIEEQEKKFRETWRHYPDKGVLREQYLEQIDNEQLTRIREIYLLEIKENVFVVEIWLYDQDDNYIKKIRTEIPKAIIKGIITTI